MNTPEEPSGSSGSELAARALPLEPGRREPEGDQ